MLTDKTVLITGGTRGIGRAVALLFAQHGAKVTCWYASNETAARELESANDQIHTAQVDVADHDAVRTGIKDLIDREGKLDILVNNAGITRDRMLATMDDEDWETILNTNLTGTFYVCREVVKDMIYNRSGKIINVSSLTGVTGLPAQTNYAAAKGGLISFTKALALELGRYEILVNAVSPGLIETDITDQLPERKKEEMVNRIPLRRMGTPEEVASLILFLASDMNTYITGQNFVIAGGLYT